MRRIENANLAELLAQLKFASLKQRRKQLEGAEKLLSLIKPDVEYPYEFVCYGITGFRPAGPEAEQILKGDALIEDIQVFISKLSGQLSMVASEQGQVIYTPEQLCQLFGVSTKTIVRWRKRGLPARRYVFDDGKKRLGFLQSAVDDFARAKPGLVSRAQGFTRLTKKQTQQIIKRAGELAGNGNSSHHRIIEQVADETDRAAETIRYTIGNHDRANPLKAVFGPASGPIIGAAAVELYRLYKQGSKIQELTNRFGRSRSTIYRVINRRRARALLAEKIEFIPSEEFLAEDAEEKILAAPGKSLRIRGQKTTIALELAHGSLQQYLQTLKRAPVLNRQQESELFRRYNYLKFLACKLKTMVSTNHTPSAVLNRLERCLAVAQIIKETILNAQLRLVVSIANKHLGRGTGLQDLISEGNMALMRAVEKFDYSKGFRFATYGSWAIAKNYARKIPAETARAGKTSSAYLADVEQDLRITAAADIIAVEQARKDLTQVIRDNLDEREQYVILNHFGLTGSSVKKDKKTLKQIGEHLGISKERVRQIELEALQKLRQYLSIEQFELLTG